MGRGSGGKSQISALLARDPRMPENARKYSPDVLRATEEEDALPPFDFSSFFGIIIGMVGVLMKQKIFCWAALLLSVQALANMKSMDNDLKQVLCSVSFAIMGLVSTYFGPTHPAASTQAS